MAKILLAWELGANLGHVAPLRALARHLTSLGHQCVFAVRDLVSAEEFIEPELGAVLQAPVRQSLGRNPVRTQVSYASLLNNSGFDEVLGLAARLRAWRELMRGCGAQLVFADHAPTALLAARTLGLPAAHLGTGFTVPPLRAPFPSFHADAKLPAGVLEHNEAAVLANVNASLARIGAAPLAALQDVLGAAAGYVTSYAELDHYETAREEPYIGVPETSHGLAPPWPSGAGPKLLVYLRPFKDFPAVLQALQQSKARVLLRVGDIAVSKLAEYQRPGLAIVEQPVDMRAAADSCDAFINYASHGVTAEMLLAGKPGLVLATNLERELVMRRGLQLGACVAPVPGNNFNLSDALRRIVEDPALRKAAEGFAARYARQDRSAILPRMADGVLARFTIR